MMTLNRLRGYYVALVLVDHAVWFGLLPFTSFSCQVNAALEFFRLVLFGLALLPARFRLSQIRAMRWVSGYYFVLGATGAWLGQICANGALSTTDASDAVRVFGAGSDIGATLLAHLLAASASCTVPGQNAWLLGLYAVLVLVINARLLPQLRLL